MMLDTRKAAELLLSFTKKKESDPLMDYRLDFQKRMEHARRLLTDARQTGFFFVTRPEALPIAVITRFINWFAAFVRNRLAMQDEHMQTVWDKFDGQVRAIVPLFEDEVRGTEMLRRLGRAVFTKDS